MFMSLPSFCLNEGPPRKGRRGVTINIQTVRGAEPQ